MKKNRKWIALWMSLALGLTAAVPYSYAEETGIEAGTENAAQQADQASEAAQAQEPVQTEQPPEPAPVPEETPEAAPAPEAVPVTEAAPAPPEAAPEETAPAAVPENGSGDPAQTEAVAQPDDQAKADPAQPSQEPSGQTTEGPEADGAATEKKDGHPGKGSGKTSGAAGEASAMEDSLAMAAQENFLKVVRQKAVLENGEIRVILVTAAPEYDTLYFGLAADEAKDPLVRGEKNTEGGHTFSFYIPADLLDAIVPYVPRDLSGNWYYEKALYMRLPAATEELSGEEIAQFEAVAQEARGVGIEEAQGRLHQVREPGLADVAGGAEGGEVRAHQRGEIDEDAAEGKAEGHPAVFCDLCRFGPARRDADHSEVLSLTLML